ncbi:hypothetical protein IFE09_27265 [Streptomyces microflavus]|nr:hypothetical protein [Streptomyces microflavus]QQZ56900.1 hypothetical protein IFE09_27265 [Streptomyces microflavus]
MPEPIIISTALGPHVAAITTRINGRLTAVVNTLAGTDPRIRTEAAVALVVAGMDAGRTLGALHGVRR